MTIGLSSLLEVSDDDKGELLTVDEEVTTVGNEVALVVLEVLADLVGFENFSTYKK